MDVRPPVLRCACHSPAFARLDGLLTRRFASLAAPVPGAAHESPWSVDRMSSVVPVAPATPVAFANVRLFDGRSDRLVGGRRVVVDGTRIRAIEDASAPAAEGVTVLDGGGRTLMPGLIDAHWHTIMAAMPKADLLTVDVGYINLVAAAEARCTLLRGFTSVRDMAGPAFSLKRAIDNGLTPGPRIWPSGAMISQTSGHGDFRDTYQVPAAQPASPSRGETIGLGAIADGAAQVLQRTREQLMLGASQIKLAAGAGVISDFDPIDVTQFTEAEFRAAVDAATNWGTYVTVHAYTPRAVQTAIRGGVRCIEHGQLIDEATARLMAGEDIWFSSQPFLQDAAHPAPPQLDPAKVSQIVTGTDGAYGFAKQYGLKTAWGTDILFDPDRTATQGAMLAALSRWYATAAILKMATSVNAELLALSGPRNPYSDAAVGVIEAGAYADLLIVDGDPFADIGLLADPERNLKVVMKDGRFYRNDLSA
ncbi:metal-dependent hydrolase family protein [Paraburkholderia lycopersici]|uniref:metal-dependent hydrolase family protein n=1 Tax=Paraburkholderia lycopersici TaxID=416944 RepID=UPI001FE00283|nr:amidohydrolase family protein [Paraburkholderia lycopersici]